MNISAIAGLMQSTALGLDSSFAMQNLNQTRLGLANQAGNVAFGGGGMNGIANLYAADRAATLKNAQAQVNLAYANAWQQQAQAMIKQDRERRQRMLANGAIFA